MIDGPTPYERIGGAEAVKALVDRFYDAMAERSDTTEVLHMHPEDLTTSREKLTEFLSGWLGGPPLYVEKYGHPRLRMRHAKFPIDSEAARQWIAAMDDALEPLEDIDLRERLATSFRRIADHMRNQ